MTTQEKSLEEMGRRAVACKQWQWMPGMLSRRHTSQGFDICRRHSEADCRPAPPADEYPDLSDPATLGCLLHLVREAWGVERAVVWWNEHDQGWVADVRPRNFVFVRDSEAHALVAALEAAP